MLAAEIAFGPKGILSTRWLTSEDTHYACVVRRQKPGRVAIMQTGKECRMSTFELRTMFCKQQFVPFLGALANQEFCELGC